LCLVEQAQSKDEKAQRAAQAKAAVKKPRTVAPLVTVFDLDWAGAVAEGLDIPLFVSVSAAEVDVTASEYTKPQLLSKPSAEAFVDNNVQVQAYLQMFLQQTPQQPATQLHGRAIGPIKASLAFTAQLKTALRACASKTNQSTKAEASLAFSPCSYWNVPNMRIIFFERSMSGCIRYQHRGESECLLFPYTALLKAFGEQEMKEQIFENVRRLSQQSLQKLVVGANGAIMRVVLSKSMVLVLPPGTLIVERALNGAASYGFRQQFTHAAHGHAFLVVYAAVRKTYPDHPHGPQMTVLADIYQH
jgi:hypothetical protein